MQTCNSSISEGFGNTCKEHERRCCPSVDGFVPPTCGFPSQYWSRRAALASVSTCPRFPRQDLDLPPYPRSHQSIQVDLQAWLPWSSGLTNRWPACLQGMGVKHVKPRFTAPLFGPLLLGSQEGPTIERDEGPRSQVAWAKGRPVWDCQDGLPPQKDPSGTTPTDRHIWQSHGVSGIRG